METNIEFTITIFLMFAGVLFYSNILSELLEMIERKLDAQERIQTKYHLLRVLQKEVKMGSNLVREMKRVIANKEEEEEEGDDGSFKPKFDNVIKKDSEQLLYEVYQDKFEGINLFVGAKKDFLIEFAQEMKERRFKQGDTIYERGTPSNFFFLIKSGSVQFVLNEQHDICFMECHGGYFGEIELMKDINRKYTVIAREPLHVYTLTKAPFFNLFQNKDRQFSREFNNCWKNREIEFEKAFIKTRELMSTLLADIRKEMNKANPFLRIQRAVYSEKFSKMYFKKKSRIDKKKRTEMNRQFLKMQAMRSPRKKKRTTLFIEMDKDGNIIEDSGTMKKPKDNRLEIIKEEGKISGKSSRRGSIQASQRVSAKLRRKQAFQKGKKKHKMNKV